ncbi:ABC transporter permease [Bailinhaonella thermotolerans]|uniref:ABC transporter permease n=1 Tax=Bailinhaonella thermotolerans TaxID=1070861 RepID=UPI001F5BB74F|nr:ABC transporter permease [Bailinhaonella thermotolerans]
MSGAIAAEWVKARTVRSTWTCLLAGAVLTVLGAVTLGGGRATELVREGVTGARLPATEGVVSAMAFAQFALVALAMLTVTSEYSSGSIRGTLQAVPVRGRVLAAKALVVAPVLFAAGVVSGALAAVANHALLAMPVFGGFGTLEPGRTAGDLLRLGVFCALAGVLTVGVGAAVRSAAGTLSVVFMLMMGLPLLLMMTGSQAAVELATRLPLFAGLAFMGSESNLTGGPIPYPAWQGLAWLVAWAALALAAGHAVLRRRDA